MSTDTLRLRSVGIDTYHENVAYLNRECSLYRAEGFQALSKIRVSENGSTLLAVLNVVDDHSIVKPGELGLSQQAFEYFNTEEGSLVTVNHAEPPKSMDAVRRKIHGESLDQTDFNEICNDIVKTRYSKMELAAFLVASGQNNLDRNELLYLTQAMLQTGKRLNWHEPLVADKHCIGGIPGNRTSMLVVPIVAAHGMLIPKTSSRAITSPAGTADTMEILSNVNLSPEQMLEIVQQQRGCLAWGGTAKLAPVDDLLISVERPLGIDSQGQMVASILSKKLAAGSTHLIIDIPVGPTAKVRQMRQALALRKLFEFVGDRLNIHLEVMITDGRQPIGFGIGPVLEARDTLQILNNDSNAPADLRQKSLQLAGRIIEFDPDVRGGHGYSIARDILESGRACEKMNDIIKAQGEKLIDLEPGKLCYQVCADRDGIITQIDNFQIAKIARMAGTPMEKKAGVDLLKKMGNKVSKGEPLYRIHAEFQADFIFAKKLAKQNSAYSIGDSEQILKPLISS